MKRGYLIIKVTTLVAALCGVLWMMRALNSPSEKTPNPVKVLFGEPNR